MHARTSPPPIHRNYDGESESHALHLLDDDDALRSLSRPKRAFPVLLLASLVAGFFVITLTRHLLTEAEQQAHMQEVISDIQSASAQPSTRDELERVQPIAEVPASETLRAFQKLSAPAEPLRSATSTRASLHLARSLKVTSAQKSKPAARAVAKTTPSPRATRTNRAERETEPDLLDDPLRDL